MNEGRKECKEKTETTTTVIIGKMQKKKTKFRER
jgi:hypothetical protein